MEPDSPLSHSSVYLFGLQNRMNRSITTPYNAQTKISTGMWNKVISLNLRDRAMIRHLIFRTDWFTKPNTPWLYAIFFENKLWNHLLVWLASVYVNPLTKTGQLRGTLIVALLPTTTAIAPQMSSMDHHSHTLVIPTKSKLVIFWLKWSCVVVRWILLVWVTYIGSDWLLAQLL